MWCFIFTSLINLQNILKFCFCFVIMRHWGEIDVGKINLNDFSIRLQHKEMLKKWRGLNTFWMHCTCKNISCFDHYVYSICYGMYLPRPLTSGGQRSTCGADFKSLSIPTILFHFSDESSPDLYKIIQMFLHYLLACSWGGSPVWMAGPAEKISVGRVMREKSLFPEKLLMCLNPKRISWKSLAQENKFLTLIIYQYFLTISKCMQLHDFHS